MFIKIITNPLFIIISLLLVILLLVKVFLDVPSSKSKKVEQVVEKKSDKNTEEDKDKKETIVKKEKKISEKKDKIKEKKQKHLKKAKPTITKVFESKNNKEDLDIKKEIEQELNPSISEDELLENMQFVKSSKKISKLVKKDDNIIKDIQDELMEMQGNAFDLIDEEYYDLKNEIENCEQCKNHFDKTRRLSKMVEDDNFDDMFLSHISDHYLNINADKHLKLNEKFMNSLYGMASRTIANSDSKVLVDDDEDNDDISIKSDKESMKSWLENRKREEMARFMLNSNDENNELSDVEKETINDIDLSAKNLIVGQMVMNRKKFLKH